MTDERASFPGQSGPSPSGNAEARKARTALKLVAVDATSVGPAGVTVMVCADDRAQTGPSVSADRVIEVLRPVIVCSAGGILVRSAAGLGPSGPDTLVAIHRRPTYHSRLTSGPTVWVSVSSVQILDALAQWIGAGGPGVAPMPSLVDDAVVSAH